MPTKTFYNLPKEKQDFILSEAYAEFAKGCYALASLTVVVKNAHIAKGSIYQYFGNKFTLYSYLVDESFKKQALVCEKIGRSQFNNLSDFAIYRLSVLLAYFYEKPDRAALCFYFLNDTQHPEVGEKSRLFRSRIYEFWLNLIATEKEQNNLKKKVEPKAFARQFADLEIYLFQNYFLAPLGFDSDLKVAEKELKDHIINICKGLLK
jgi:AcrR family transcriptional regulator